MGESERGGERRPARHAGWAGGDQHGQRLDQARRHPEQRGPLADGFPHPGEIAAGQIADPAVHDAEAVRGGGAAEVAALDQGDLEPAQGGVPGDEGALDAATDHE